MKIGMAIALIDLGAKLKRRNFPYFITSLSRAGIVLARNIINNIENPRVDLENIYIATDTTNALRMADCYLMHRKDMEVQVWLPSTEDLRADDWELAETLVISAFPGTGKTVLTQYKGLNILDSDSSKFDKAGFPDNYIKHIKEKADTYDSDIPALKPFVDILCVSSHKVVRDAMKADRIHYTLVYPYLESKEEYLDRYRKRGSSEAFITLLDSNWKTWLSECCYQKGCTHYRLLPQQYLSDAVGLNVLDIEGFSKDKGADERRARV